MNERDAYQSFSLRLTASIAIVCLVAGFGLGYGLYPHIASSSGITAPNGEPTSVDLSPVWKAWDVLTTHFVPDAVATSSAISNGTTTSAIDQQKVWGMISGMAQSLNDPYTFFLPPQQNKDFSSDMSGIFGGIGMQIDIKDTILTVVSPLKGTPADRAGIKSGDQVLAIDGKSTAGMDVSSAVNAIRGPSGTTVTLSIFRTGWTAPKEFKVARAIINVPIVKEESHANGVFVISVSQFTSSAPDLFREGLRQFIESGDHKLILDLRGNPGGYLDAAVSLGSWFLPSGKVIVTEDYDGHAESIVHRSLGYNIFNKNLKMVILVDKGSASASEILADALRYYGIGKIVGTNTYGKGVVQELFEITPETSLKVTVARWLGPDGVQIPHAGIVPDIVATTSEAAIKAGKDEQLDAAMRVLNAM
jgi:carboxyl-terminal processing protease